MLVLVAAWVRELVSVSLELSQVQSLWFAFLLGSFAVATLSDLKRLSAQREFLEIWVVFTAGVFAYDAFTTWRAGWELWQVPAVKWGLIVVLAVVSWERVGGVFRLARADVFACAATAALLSPVLVVAFWVVLKLVALALRPLLQAGRGPWPFMPVVTVATLVVLGVGIVAPGQAFTLVP